MLPSLLCLLLSSIRSLVAHQEFGYFLFNDINDIISFNSFNGINSLTSKIAS